MSSRNQIDRYLARHATSAPEAERLPPPADDLSVVVTIPVYRERETLPDVLDSLRSATSQAARFEAIVVVNNPSDAPVEARRENAKTLEWIEAMDFGFAVHPIDRATRGSAFAPDEAGVGRARRLAMDLALGRLRESSGRCSVIAGLDGDSPVAPGYIDQLVAAFDRAPDSVLAGSCRHRHPLPDDRKHAAAIASYEAWMRYFEAGLSAAGSPYAFQSIGSCLALRARGYALADGCPEREALSDFYLLQKVVKNGGPASVRQLREPLVYPSARPSQRVPRGTGPSVADALRGGGRKYRRVEPPEVFAQLAELIDAVPDLFDDPGSLEERVDGDLARFLRGQGAPRALEKLRANAPDPERFAHTFHQWFDSLLAVKFANWCRRERGETWIFDAVPPILRMHDLASAAGAVPDPPPGHATVAQWRRLLGVLRRVELEIGETVPRDGGGSG